jgi:hypothetical protein
VSKETIEICILCEREVPFLTDHHIVPKSRGGKDLVAICRDCHRQLHALFENKVLESDLNTVEAIIANDSFVKYLKWVDKRPFGAVHKAKRAKDSRSRGRRG